MTDDSQANTSVMLYRPSNGTEGADFIDYFCGHCERDRNNDCPILAASFAYNINEPGYPPEWCYAKNEYSEYEPTCTAFVERGEPVPPPVDTLTPDMFTEQTS